MTAACSESGGGSTTGLKGDGGGNGGSPDASTRGSQDGGSAGQNGNGGGGSDAGNNTSSNDPFNVLPEALQTIDVDLGATQPGVEFKATQGGRAVSAAFAVDRGDAAAITAGPTVTAFFSPTGAVGGLVTVTAGYQGKIVKRQVLIRLRASQNGASTGQAEQVADDITDLTAGGGVGGVGGEGLGGAIADASVRGALAKPVSDGSAEGLSMLYPYDKTVWPRGLRAPLLMWSWMKGDADGVRIELETTSGSYRWSGTFGRPAILTQTGKPFTRHPIPQAVWDAATKTAGGLTQTLERDRLIVKLTVVKAGMAAGPITQTWTVAPGRLSGTIYYNSYGTQLAKNYTENGKTFGGAVLSIRVGDTAPRLAAGETGDRSQCRVCHSVSADGSRLIATYENGAKGTSYALTPMGIVATPMSAGAEFPGIYPDGSFALTRSGTTLAMPGGGPTAIPPKDLAAVATAIGTPAFDPSGKRVAFNPMSSSSVTTPLQKLLVMDFEAATNTFSKVRTVVDKSGLAAEQRPGWPAFLPDGESLVFHQQSDPGLDGNGYGDLRTRRGAKAQIHWTNAVDATQVTPLNALNGLDASGKSYLPKLASPFVLACNADGKAVGGMDADHPDDANLNYEPTVNPVPSGGYAWVVFTSRRLYGDVASIPPFCSDPRGADLLTNITPKKLWVAAIDLGAKPGKDASHPAFYLPSQELLAGNARGFWVLDPCRKDGDSCDSGDQCCNGFCTKDATSGALQCDNMPPDAQCSAQGDKCQVREDCCDPSDVCVGGFCSLVIVQ